MSHVGMQDVQPNSPAAQAGLMSDTDYIIGADTVLHEVCFGLRQHSFLFGHFLQSFVSNTFVGWSCHDLI
jgi:hypothetical protein